MDADNGVRGFATDGRVAAGPLLDAERLDVYRVALEFHAVAAGLSLGRGLRELRDQIDRASTSIVLNIAEGAGRRGAADRARFFAMARGSATECAAIFDIVRARRLALPEVTTRGRSLLVRIVQMLTRLCQHLDARAAASDAPLHRRQLGPDRVHHGLWAVTSGDETAGQWCGTGIEVGVTVVR